MTDEEFGKPHPDPSLTPNFQTNDIQGRVFGKTFSRSLREGMDIVWDKDPDNIYAINFRIDPSRVNIEKGEAEMMRLRPKSIPTNDLTMSPMKLDYNDNNRFDVVSVRFAFGLDKKKWNPITKLAFAKRIRTAWQMSGHTT